MKVTRFDTDADLIIVDGRVSSRDAKHVRSLSLVLDTGAGETIIIPEVSSARSNRDITAWQHSEI